MTQAEAHEQEIEQEHIYANLYSDLRTMGFPEMDAADLRTRINQFIYDTIVEMRK